MALDELQAEIADLVNQMDDHPTDKREICLLLQEKLNEMRAFGMPLPNDLVELEQLLERELGAASGD